MEWEDERPGSVPPLSRPEQRGIIDNRSLNLNRIQRQLAVDGCTALDIWRHMRPYGIWTCGDGREVMFNRSYIPILERRPGQPVRAANPREWVFWIEQTWFYSDRTPPNVVIIAMNVALADWGLPPMPKMPTGRLSPSSPSIRRKWTNPYASVLANRVPAPQ